MKDALIVTDIQNDFLPGGALAVPDGDQVVPVANGLLSRFGLVIATQDWHPRHHRSFASSHPGKNVGDTIELAGLPQILWPDHCVQGTPGADFAPSLRREGIHEIVRKGTDPNIDSYSAFFDNAHRKATGLEAFLREREVETVWILGLATDYCVRFTALDALRLGFATRLIVDGSRGVELQPGDCARAIEEVRAAGGKIVRASEARVDAP